MKWPDLAHIYESSRAGIEVNEFALLNHFISAIRAMMLINNLIIQLLWEVHKITDFNLVLHLRSTHFKTLCTFLIARFIGKCQAFSQRDMFMETIFIQKMQFCERLVSFSPARWSLNLSEACIYGVKGRWDKNSLTLARKYEVLDTLFVFLQWS